MTPLDLLGVWTFARRITDHRGGSGYQAHGTASFEALEDGRVRWFEEGRLSWEAGTSTFTRTLFLVPDAPGGSGRGEWSVLFEDGRFFHPWRDDSDSRDSDGGGSGSRDVVHLCGRDTYRGSRRADASGAGWSLSWRVKGPEKEYTMTTRYQRLAAG